MKILDELDAAERKCTPAPWLHDDGQVGPGCIEQLGDHTEKNPVHPEETRFNACWNSYPPQYGCECGKYSSDADGEFIAFSRNHMRQLLDLAFAAKKFHDNFNKYWTGYPSKMDWPELHVLRQKLEVLDEGFSYEGIR